jgi:hypothetical protein
MTTIKEYMDDLVSANILALKGKGKEIYNLMKTSFKA